MHIHSHKILINFTLFVECVSLSFTFTVAVYFWVWVCVWPCVVRLQQKLRLISEYTMWMWIKNEKYIFFVFFFFMKKASHRWTRKPLPTWGFEIAHTICTQKRPTELPIDAKDASALNTHIHTNFLDCGRDGASMNTMTILREWYSCKTIKWNKKKTK